MGSRRKVRSRVHGGVKEARDRLLFAPPLPPPAPPLPSYRRMWPRRPQRPHRATASQTRTGCLFCCAYETFPRQENSSITASAAAASRALCCPPQLPHGPFVCSLHDVKFLLPVYTFTGSLSFQPKHAALSQFFSNVLIQKKGQEQFKQSKNINLRRE